MRLSHHKIYKELNTCTVYGESSEMREYFYSSSDDDVDDEDISLKLCSQKI
jgi:hypothetical protein